MQYKSQIQKTGDDDHIYYNAFGTNTSNTDQAITYKDIFTSPIVKNPSEYHLAIVRFKIPATQAIFVFQDNTYYVTLSYGGNDYSTVVSYVQDDLTNSNNRNLYFYNDFIQAINTAFATSFTALKTAHAGAPPTIAPYITYNASTSIFTLWGDTPYDPALAMASTITIWMNWPLFEKFGNFPSNFNGYNNANYKDFQLILIFRYNNEVTGTPNLLFQTQETPRLGAINTLYSILLTTQMPVKSEFIPASPLSLDKTTSSSNSQKILTDFEPSFSPNEDITSTGYFQFAQIGPYRYIDLATDQPLNQIDFQVYYTDSQGVITPLTIPPGFSFTVKIMLEKKTHYGSSK
jgi:hypothetical protein